MKTRGWILGLVVVAAIGGLVLAPGGARRFAVRLFGPPPATLAEAHPEGGTGARFDHTAFDALLRGHVELGGWIDYAGFGRDRAKLQAYIVSLAGAPFDELGRDEKLAFLINAYNAFTIDLILEHMPVASIKDIPAKARWDHVRWSLAGATVSLNQIEHEQVRPKFREPRIHFALVCAAVGCPPLRAEAYVGDRLEEQLDDQTRYVHANPRWFRQQGSEQVGLTALYDWYGDDFVQVAGSVLDFVGRYVPAVAKAERKPKVRYLDYDWNLNSVANRPAP